MQNRVRVQVGLLDFEYCASLHIEHLELNPDVVSAALQKFPKQTHRAGEALTTPSGKSLKGTYPAGYWMSELEVRNGENVAQFLDRIAVELSPGHALLRQIVDDGGSVECFIGIFARKLCDHVLPSHILLKLGTLGVDLRLDYYKIEDTTDREDCTQ